MTRVLIFAAALIVGAGGAKASDWKPCATGFKPENSTFQKPPPAWAIKKMKKECVLPVVSSTTGKTTGECVTPDLNDGVWQHAWCDYSAHKILWCLPSDEISPVYAEAFKTFKR